MLKDGSLLSDWDKLLRRQKGKWQDMKNVTLLLFIFLDSQVLSCSVADPGRVSLFNQLLQNSSNL